MPTVLTTTVDTLRPYTHDTRTAQEYSNTTGRERPRQAATRQRPAPTTSNDLVAESSHRGGQSMIFVCAGLNLAVPPSEGVLSLWHELELFAECPSGRLGRRWDSRRHDVPGLTP